MWRFFPDADANQGLVKLTTLICGDSAVGGGHLPMVGRSKLLREIVKEELDCGPRDIPLDSDVQGIKTGH